MGHILLLTETAIDGKIKQKQNKQTNKNKKSRIERKRNKNKLNSDKTDDKYIHVSVH